MSVRIVECEQNSPEWHAARAGLPTASRFATVMASGRSGADSKTRSKYLRTLVGERITRRVQDGYSNASMERGHEQEDDARRLYAFQSGNTPTLIGFMVRDDLGAGASPDALIGADGLLEIKTKQGDLQIEVLLRDEVPAEHMAQLQGQLLISGRQWVDFVSYCPGLPLFVKRVPRDEIMLARITVELREFIAEMEAMEARITAIAA